MQQRPVRYAGLFLDSLGGSAGIAVLDQAVDRGVEQVPPRLIALLLSGSRWHRCSLDRDEHSSRPCALIDSPDGL